MQPTIKQLKIRLSGPAGSTVACLFVPLQNGSNRAAPTLQVCKVSCSGAPSYSTSQFARKMGASWSRADQLASGTGFWPAGAQVGPVTPNCDVCWIGAPTRECLRKAPTDLCYRKAASQRSFHTEWRQNSTSRMRSRTGVCAPKSQARGTQAFPRGCAPAQSHSYSPSRGQSRWAWQSHRRQWAHFLASNWIQRKQQLYLIRISKNRERWCNLIGWNARVVGNLKKASDAMGW